MERTQTEESHNDHRRHGCYVLACWEHDEKESEWVICSEQKRENLLEIDTDYKIEIQETNLESIKNYRKRLQEQNERISSLVLKISIVISTADDKSCKR